MSIAELGPVVILWYETDVSEKHREKGWKAYTDA